MSNSKDDWFHSDQIPELASQAVMNGEVDRAVKERFSELCPFIVITAHNIQRCNACGINQPEETTFISIHTIECNNALVCPACVGRMSFELLRVRDDE